MWIRLTVSPSGAPILLNINKIIAVRVNSSTQGSNIDMDEESNGVLKTYSVVEPVDVVAKKLAPVL